MESDKKILIAVTCMDWRMHHPKSNYVQGMYDMTGADKIYFISFAGPDGVTLDEYKARYDFLLNEIRLGAKLFKGKGYSNITSAVFAHTDCAGHHVEGEVHKRDIVELRNRLNTDGIPDLSENVTSVLSTKGDDDMTWSHVEV